MKWPLTAAERAFYIRMPGMKRIIEQAERAERPAWPEAARTQRMKIHAHQIHEFGKCFGRKLPLKSQPWVTEANGNQMRFGTVSSLSIERGRPVVTLEGGDERTFDSVEELVKIWAVD